MDEREVLRAWRDLFHGKGSSPEAVAKAETLLESLSGESPLHLRLQNELDELKNGAKPAKKRVVAKRATAPKAV